MLPAGWTLNQGAVHQATALKRAIDVYCNFQLLISRVTGHVPLPQNSLYTIWAAANQVIANIEATGVPRTTQEWQ
jgi:hypothetical protein